ncbi:M16 family metallopeptidase [Paenibacillus sp. An7]|uniref:M16 family metallopeptidase n=1 Tax=Paenibacillus sp. An7 TaxID=2689577 RepID=UPI00135C09F5|nr:pitrilysin family protein [Paenibacillus sp. An7]
MKFLLDQEMMVYRLSNGMRVQILPRPYHVHTFSALSISYGAIHDSIGKDYNVDLPFAPHPYGTAHFLEHMMFYQPGKSAKQQLHDRGASTSALTRYDVTTYQLASTECFQSNLSLFLDFIFTPYFQEEHIQAEKSIIKQELGNYTDEPVWLCMQQLLSMLYGENHVLAKDVAGTEISIEEITPFVLQSVYQQYYTPSQMALTIAGPVNADFIVDFLEKKLPLNISSTSNETWKLPISCSEDFYREIPGFQAIPIVQFGFRGNLTHTSERELVTLMIGIEALLGENSSFFQNAVHRGLINKTASWEHYYRSSFAFSIMSGFSIDPRELYNQVISCLEALPRKGIDKKIIDMSRMKCIGLHYSELDSLKYACMKVSENALIGLNHIKLGELLLQPTYEEINSLLYEYAVPEKLRMSVIT